MDQDSLLNLYEYDHYANQLVLQTARKLSPEALNSQSSPSHGSVFALLVHYWGTQAYFLGVCQGNILGKDRPWPEINTLSDLESAWEMLTAEINQYLQQVTQAELDEVIDVPLGSRLVHLPRWQLLAQGMLHAQHHRGELSIVMSGSGQPLPTLDAILYHIQQSGQTWP